MKLETVKLYKGDECAVVNVSDRESWENNGWGEEVAAPNPDDSDASDDSDEE